GAPSRNRERAAWRSAGGLHCGRLRVCTRVELQQQAKAGRSAGRRRFLARGPETRNDGRSDPRRGRCYTEDCAAKLSTRHPRRDGRVVEGARLESVYRGNSIEGSNPSLSAIKDALSTRSRPSSPNTRRLTPRR